MKHTSFTAEHRLLHFVQPEAENTNPEETINSVKVTNDMKPEDIQKITEDFNRLKTEMIASAIEAANQAKQAGKDPKKWENFRRNVQIAADQEMANQTRPIQFRILTAYKKLQQYNEKANEVKLTEKYGEIKTPEDANKLIDRLQKHYDLKLGQYENIRLLGEVMSLSEMVKRMKDAKPELQEKVQKLFTNCAQEMIWAMQVTDTVEKNLMEKGWTKELAREISKEQHSKIQEKDRERIQKMESPDKEG